MKHLRNFKKFPPDSPAGIMFSIRDYIEDILIELDDIGGYYNRVRVDSGLFMEVDIDIRKKKEEDFFKYSEVKDTLWSIIDYLKGLGYKVTFFRYFDRNNTPSTYYSINDELNIEGWIKCIMIEFKKL